jgi:hypothetical protein
MKLKTATFFDAIFSYGVEPGGAGHTDSTCAGSIRLTQRWNLFLHQKMRPKCSKLIVNNASSCFPRGISCQMIQKIRK